MTEKLLKAVVELTEATYERDFISGNPTVAHEERVFDAARTVLDEILADSDLAHLHSWVRELRAKEKASLAKFAAE
ncbi:MAG: hypothetical protein C5B56_00665 [Proteobacteria bacterium]|jgi:hypothetical protein|nr:MAG: hypothetical protein C5B56_00665 [Pseudomonadota bacterium]